MSSELSVEQEGMADAAGRCERMAQIQQLLKQGFPWMLFPASLEQEFMAQKQGLRPGHVWLTGLISLLVFNSFLLVDYLMAPDVFQTAMWLRLGVFSPIALALLVLQWLWRDTPLGNPAVTELGLLLSGLGAAATLLYVLAITASNMTSYYHVGFTVIVVYGNVVLRARFWGALIFSLGVVCIHWWGVFVTGGLHDQVMLPVMAWMFSAALFTLISNYALERDERRRFLLTQRERELVNELSAIHLRLRELSRVDVLTALFNRRHFQNYLSQAWQRAAQEGREVAIIMMDLDHFKQYNDHYGHPPGDQCLRQVASEMQASLRQPGDMVARFGGEEFIAVLPHTSLALAVQAAERVRRAIEALAMPHEGSDTASVVTVSLGVACCVASQPGMTPEALISSADQALYRAKGRGRNQVCAVPDSPIDRIQVQHDVHHREGGHHPLAGLF